MNERRTVQVVPLLRLHHLGDRRFDYLVPPDSQHEVTLGSVVYVPFGRRTVRAVVVGETEGGDAHGAALREIEQVTPERVPSELLDLAQALSRRYLASVESCLRLVTPPERPGARSGRRAPSRSAWVVRAATAAHTGDAALAATGHVAASGDAAAHTGDAALAAAIATPAASATATAGDSAGDAASAGAATGAAEGAGVTPLTTKQRALLATVPQQGGPPADLCRAAGVGRTVLQALVKKGILLLQEAPPEGGNSGEIGPDAAGGEDGGGDDAGDVPSQIGRDQPELARSTLLGSGPSLNPEQQDAVARLSADYESPEFSHRLLWGVTGSGKTEVYLQLMARALERGEGAILLVPEIALTPQTIARVKDRFGDRVAALHSGLGKAERARQYESIVAGRAPLVVGARSAVFAPVPRLRLIIIDEAHETSYKQEEEPRYHVATVARLRLSRGGLLLEGTATPSVESMRMAGERVRLSQRAVGEEPVCEVVDMRRQGPGLLLAPCSREALAATLRRNEQAVVLLNRRGYAAYVHCEPCGHVLMCRDCELSLTYHSGSRRLLCHHCGRGYDQPPRCPNCSKGPLTRGSPGTERLARELKGLVPREQVFQMDSDVLGGGRRAQVILDAFAGTHPAVLLGTQMVAKGHDFPDVTLVLVADADTGLYLPDFRASERTFQLLRQVAGRAGRAGRPGRVLVQTWNPDVPCIRMALERDERGFYEEELRTRARLGYPPFTEMLRLLTIAKDADRAQAAAAHLAERLAPYLGARSLWGPARLPTLRGKARWHLLVAAGDGERMRAIVGRAAEQLSGPYRRRGVVLLVDVDPFSFG